MLLIDRSWIIVYSFMQFLDVKKKIIDKITSKQFKDNLSWIFGYIDEKVFDKHQKAILKI